MVDDHAGFEEGFGDAVSPGSIASDVCSSVGVSTPHGKCPGLAIESSQNRFCSAARRRTPVAVIRRMPMFCAADGGHTSRLACLCGSAWFVGQTFSVLMVLS